MVGSTHTNRKRFGECLTVRICIRKRIGIRKRRYASRIQRRYSHGSRALLSTGLDYDNNDHDLYIHINPVLQLQ
jgi:hypothetical protein